MIDMETGTWEGVRFIESRPVAPSKVVVSKALADAAKRHFGLTDDQMSDVFIVMPPITPQIDPREAMNRKALHRQELDRLRKRR